MKVLRTPDDRFADLPDYPFAPNYLQIMVKGLGEVRQHYVDEGARDGPVVLLLHGEPSWSYLYRHMIPPLIAAGFRVIAPDLIGFGKSDKPVEMALFSYAGHVAWLTQFIDALALDGITLFCQDWGGLLGLRLVAQMPDRFRAVVASNTGLPIGTPPSPAFMAWRAFAANSPDLPIGAILQQATVRTLTDREVAAYDAPFVDIRYKAAARAFPLLVPIDVADPGAADNLAAWSALAKFDRPFLTLFGDSDAVTAGGEQYFIERIPGAAGQPHRILPQTGHFSQEDSPAELAAAIVGISNIH
jgi:haloalkane dehalogenase